MHTVIEHSYESLQAVLKEAKEGELLFTVLFSGYRLQFRSFHLYEDIGRLSTWLNTVAARKFWDENNSIEHLSQLYSGIMQNPQAISLIASLNDEPVCLIDVYLVLQDELSLYTDAGPNDPGIHFLMAPANKKIQNLSVCCMQQCLQFLFSFKEVEIIYGEPDSNNVKANALVQKAGFTFLKQQSLSYKQANIYTCTKAVFSQQMLYSLNEGIRGFQFPPRQTRSWE
ncbi:MAG TPA: GNAT family N-acetyltransferase [Parafilimonas sp.]|nr:GNAT family N-acetyltransferase [Parafilimonas sp.]